MITTSQCWECARASTDWGVRKQSVSDIKSRFVSPPFHGRFRECLIRAPWPINSTACDNWQAPVAANSENGMVALPGTAGVAIT
jgi:hypothetical protein